MRRLALLLGFYSVCGQVLLLRELVSSFNGDELFIGAALFGWLIAVAAGAYLAGRFEKSISPRLLFAVGAVILPLTIIAVRFSPFLIVDTLAEVIPFRAAAVISILLMLPTSLVAGWLFPLISRFGWDSRGAIVDVYLFEGLGAFAGGVVITLALGSLLSTLTASLAVAAVIIGCSLTFSHSTRWLAGAGVGIVLLIAALLLGAPLDNYLDRVRYDPYQVQASFDTHYGHQALLIRDSSLVLVTDNLIEASYPDREGAENLLLPPLLYHPDARDLLVIGRTEFGAAQLASSLPNLRLFMLDARGTLSDELEELLPDDGTTMRIHDDPLSFFADNEAARQFDIITFSSGPPDSYRRSRLFTPTALQAMKSKLLANGVVACALPYDSERYVTPATTRLISSVYKNFASCFRHVELWPGAQTLILASDDQQLHLPLDTLIGRAAALQLEPLYLNAGGLSDRLGPLRQERLQGAIDQGVAPNTLDRPLLPHYHFAWRTQAGGLEGLLARAVSANSWWPATIPALLLLLLTWSLAEKRGRGRYPLFLYVVAGIVSLSLELLAFYLYQSAAGSLYSEMAMLIGAFMLGLAFGTLFSRRYSSRGLEYPSLGMLLAGCLALLLTYDSVPKPAMLLYYMFFQFVVATGAAAVFVAATNWYYASEPTRNRGSGYASELIGSSLGALLATTLLLPLLGVVWMLLSLILLLIVALAGSLVAKSG